jgi:hypothetical protein
MSNSSTKPNRRGAVRARGRRNTRRNKKVLGWVAAAGLVGFLAYGAVAFQSGPEAGAGGTSGGTAATTYGFVADDGSPVDIAEVAAAGIGTEATVEGTVVEMGPTMGCWLIVDDGTGRIMVQTDPMTYVHQAVRGQTIRATGRLQVVNGGMGYSGQQAVLLTSGISVSDRA